MENRPRRMRVRLRGRKLLVDINEDWLPLEHQTGIWASIVLVTDLLFIVALLAFAGWKGAILLYAMKHLLGILGPAKPISEAEMAQRFPA